MVRKEIGMAIEVLGGTDLGFDPPFRAFEVVVRKQILHLEQPIKTCVDLVIEELSNAVRTCTQKVSRKCNSRHIFRFFFQINVRISDFKFPPISR